ncbi:MAG: triose-phosphate isomerase [Gammaproteobacteria bacterium]|nr:MAG: triose-phosphate isomerase [Gammaproteobacteria bacterium]
MRKIAAGNWKMHGSRRFVIDFVHSLAESLDGHDAAGQVLLFPSFGYLTVLAEALRSAGLESAVGLGGQTLHAEPAGAFTGEVSGEMLADLGARWALVGHSERRQYAGETDELIATKVAGAIRAGLKPMLCVGETEAEREAGQARDVVVRQLEAVLAEHADGLGAVAYEPVWAIGTGRTATPELAQEMHGVIRAVLAERSAALAENLPLLYGGSVKGNNARTLFAEQDIDGGLVGGASLEAEEFAEIVRALDE